MGRASHLENAVERYLEGLRNLRFVENCPCSRLISEIRELRNNAIAAAEKKIAEGARLETFWEMFTAPGAPPLEMPALLDKNEELTEENRRLTEEIRRLKEENRRTTKLLGAAQRKNSRLKAEFATGWR